GDAPRRPRRAGTPLPDGTGSPAAGRRPSPGTVPAAGAPGPRCAGRGVEGPAPRTPPGARSPEGPEIGPVEQSRPDGPVPPRGRARRPAGGPVAPAGLGAGYQRRPPLHGDAVCRGHLAPRGDQGPARPEPRGLVRADALPREPGGAGVPPRHDTDPGQGRPG